MGTGPAGAKCLSRLRPNDRGQGHPRSYLRTNKVGIFPYVSNPQHEVFGASGAARYAMAKLLPIVTTNVNHFSDLPTLKGDTPEQLADAVDRMFSNSLAYKQQVERQVAYLDANTWANVAQRHMELFTDAT